jgi:hypothetical protein
MPHSRRFVFHGHAAALGGRIIREGDGREAKPVKDGFINFPGSSLTVVGGKSTATISPRQIEHPTVQKFIRFDSADSIATGEYDDPEKYFRSSLKRADRGKLKTTTIVQTKVLGLDVGVDGEPRMHVTGVRGGFTSRSAADGTETPVRLDPDTGFDGNSVAFFDKEGNRYTLIVEVDLRPFNTNPTFSALTAAAKTPQFAQRFGAALFLNAPKGAAKGKGKKKTLLIARPKLRRTDGGAILGSIVKPVRWEGTEFPGSTIDPKHPNRVKIPDFGTVSFGEILVDRQSRRITMLRGDLGSYMGAEMAACDFVDNGSWG